MWKQFMQFHKTCHGCTSSNYCFKSCCFETFFAISFMCRKETLRQMYIWFMFKMFRVNKPKIVSGSNILGLRSNCLLTLNIPKYPSDMSSLRGFNGSSMSFWNWSCTTAMHVLLLRLKWKNENINQDLRHTNLLQRPVYRTPLRPNWDIMAVNTAVAVKFIRNNTQNLKWSMRS